MKKIKLNLEGKASILSKEQMKKISGGYACCRCENLDHTYYIKPANAANGCDGNLCTKIGGVC